MLSIILPTYLERDNLAILLPKIAGAVGRPDYEIIIVDDDSRDGTRELVSAIASKDPRVRLLKRKCKLGLASAIQDGAAFSKGKDILVMDADLSHPPEKIMELCAALDGADIVVASRNLPGGGVENWPIERKVISSGATLIARLLIGARISDPMSGFFAVKKDVFNRTQFRVKGYKILLNILADNPGIKVVEVPYMFRNRFAGRTKLGAVEIVNYLADIARLLFPA